MITVLCHVCGAELKRYSSYLKTHPQSCCLPCITKIKTERFAALKGNPRIGSDNPNWKGGKIVRPDGRSAIYAPDREDAWTGKGTYVLEYRLIAEKKIGRALRSDEIVHHVNGDVSDGSPENLEVMTQAEHARQHCQSRRNPITGRFI
jgi:hypothetical protein